MRKNTTASLSDPRREEKTTSVHRKCAVCGSINFLKRLVSTSRMFIATTANSVEKDFHPHVALQQDLDDTFSCESCGMEYEESDILSLPTEESPEPKCAVCYRNPACMMYRLNRKYMAMCTRCFLRSKNDNPNPNPV